MITETSEISRREQANTLGLAFLRTMILLNGGAILSVLTFIGNASAQVAVAIPLDATKHSIVAFLISITVMMIALILSYIYTASAPETGWSKSLDIRIISINVVLSLLSLATFACGVISLVFGAVQIT